MNRIFLWKKGSRFFKKCFNSLQTELNDYKSNAFSFVLYYKNNFIPILIVVLNTTDFFLKQNFNSYKSLTRGILIMMFINCYFIVRNLYILAILIIILIFLYLNSLLSYEAQLGW